MDHFAVFCMGLATAVSAHAGTVLALNCQTSLTNITPSQASSSSTISCPLFDSSLGTLTQATFLGEGFIDSGSITLRNNSGSTTVPNPIVLRVNMQFGPVLGDSATKTIIAPVSVGGGSLLPNQTTMFLVTYSGALSEGIFPATTGLASFVASPGASTFDVPFSITTDLIQEGLSGTVSVLDYSLNVWPGSMTIAPSQVIYAYDPAPATPGVPEPTTSALVGSGLAGAWLYRRSRSKTVRLVNFWKTTEG